MMALPQIDRLGRFCGACCRMRGGIAPWNGEEWKRLEELIGHDEARKTRNRAEDMRQQFIGHPIPLQRCQHLRVDNGCELHHGNKPAACVAEQVGGEVCISRFMEAWRGNH